MKTVRVVVQGGIVIDVDAPADVQVIVIDRDVAAVDAERDGVPVWKPAEPVTPPAPTTRTAEIATAAATLLAARLGSPAKCAALALKLFSEVERKHDAARTLDPVKPDADKPASDKAANTSTTKHAITAYRLKALGGSCALPSKYGLSNSQIAYGFPITYGDFSMCLVWLGPSDVWRMSLWLNARSQWCNLARVHTVKDVQMGLALFGCKR